jgi:ankyrin repeat protein
MSPVWMLWTPWNVFQDYTQSLSYNIPEDILITVPIILHARHYGRKVTKVSLTQFSEGSNVANLHTYLPDPQMTTTFGKYDQRLATQERTTSAHLLTFVVGLISNNMEIEKFAPIVVDLARSHDFQILLQDLLDRNFGTIRALAEKLLHFAVIHDNLALVKLLIKSHVDINLRSNADEGPAHRSALEYAVRNGNLHIVDYLLQQGAKPQSDILEIALAVRRPEVICCLLNHARHMRGKWPRASLNILYRTIIMRQAENLKLLLQHEPELLHLAKAESWVVGAARHRGSPETIEVLASHGLDISTVCSCEHEGGLAAASWEPDMSLVTRLLAAGINIDETEACCRWSQYSNFYILDQIRGKSALHVAIQRGHVTLARLLIDRGASVQKICFMSTIQAAAARGNPQIVSMLLLAGVDVNSVSSSAPFTALCLAIGRGNIEVAEMLFDAGASLLSKTTDTLRDYVWEELWLSIVRRASASFLRKLVSDWNGRRRYPLPPACIGLCIRRLGPGIMKELLEWGRVATKSEGYFHIIHEAITARDESMVGKILQLLVAEPAAFSRDHGPVALLHATKKKNLNIVQMILRTGVDPFARVSKACAKSFGITTDEDTSAFMDSVRYSPCEIFQTYLDNQGPTLFSDRPIAHQEQMCKAYVLVLGWGALDREHLLLCHGVTHSVVSRIMGADYLNQELYSKLLDGHSDYNLPLFDVERFLQLGVSLANCNNKRQEWQYTRLQISALDNDAFLFRKFLDLGEDIHAPPCPSKGATALQYAAINGNFTIVNMCLEAEADVNAAAGDHEGRTAIEGAAEWGRLDMVRYLLEAGAMIQGRTNINYRRTVYRAWENGHRALVGMIQVWKREQYGEDDCEDPEVIVQTMTKDELVYASEEARLTYLSKKKGYCSGRGPVLGRVARP